MHLIGVYHGGFVKNLLTGWDICSISSPGPELLDAIAGYPAGTRVGVECCTPGSWTAVKRHLTKLNEGLKHAYVDYDDRTERYWGSLVSASLDRGHNIIHLDNPNMWFRYNHAMIDSAKASTRRSRSSGNESRMELFLRGVDYHDRLFRAETRMRRIQQIEREDSLLDSIRDSRPDVVVVGAGHSDYWMQHRDATDGSGLSFERYSTERFHDIGTYYVQVFKEDDSPDPLVVADRKSLKRTIGLLEGKRISEKEPDFVGTWKTYNPAFGYFEMLVDGGWDGGKGPVSGVIEDLKGTADFNGEISESGFRFTKRYRPGQHEADIIREDIVYEGEGSLGTGVFQGYFRYSEGGVAFIVRKAPRGGDVNPRELAKLWYELRVLGQQPSTD